MARGTGHPAKIITLEGLLRDPLIRAVMKADHVDEAELRSLFRTIRGRRAPHEGERRAAEVAAIRYGLDAHYRPGVGIMLFDAQGQVIAMFFGERKPGRSELPGWRSLAHGLLQADDAALEVAA